MDYKKLGIIFIISMMIFSCKKKEERPQDILARDQFEKVMLDLLLANASIVQNGVPKPIDSLYADTLFSKVINTHKTDLNTIKKTMEYYTTKPDSLSDVMNKCINDISKMQ